MLEQRFLVHRPAVPLVAWFLVLLSAACGDEKLSDAKAPVLAVSSTALDFGNRRPASRTTLSLVLTNEGGSRLDISSARIEDDARQAFSVGTVPASVGVGESATLEVTYGAASEGPDGAVLVIKSNSRWSSDLLVSLAGRTLAPCASNERDCDGACVDLQREVAHCGACGRQCGSEEACVEGVCSEPTTVVAPAELTYSPSTLVCTINHPCLLGAPSSSGGAITSFAISPALPEGLGLNANTGEISGTPTVPSSATSYTVTATNPAGSTTATISIAVKDLAPTGLTYSPASLDCYTGEACALPAPTVSGGPVTSWSVSPALPAGLSLSETDGAISGSPTAAQVATAYTVMVTNSGGSATASVTISVSTRFDGLLEIWAGHANAVKLSDTRMVVAYTDGATDRTVAPTSLVLRTFDRSGDTFTTGSPVRVDIPLCKADSDQCIQLMGALGSSHFLMVTQDANYERHYRLFKISGTGIALVQSLSAGDAAWFWGHPVDDTRYIVRYREGNSGEPVKYRVVTRSGDSISLGTAISRPAPGSFSGLEAKEPQADAPLTRTGANTFREVRAGYVWRPGYLGSWALTISGSTLSASGPIVHSNSQDRTMSPHIASNGSGHTVVLYPSYQNGWHAGYFMGSTFSTNGSISDTSSYWGTQSGDNADGFINDAYYVRLRTGTLYRFATVSTAPTVHETDLAYSACADAPGIMKSGDYGVFLTCTLNGALRLRTLKL